MEEVDFTVGNSYKLFVWYNDEKDMDSQAINDVDLKFIDVFKINLAVEDHDAHLLFDYYVPTNKFKNVFYTLFLNGTVIYNEAILNKDTLLSLVEDHLE
jgi:hypothetical protein